MIKADVHQTCSNKPKHDVTATQNKKLKPGLVALYAFVWKQITVSLFL